MLVGVDYHTFFSCLCTELCSYFKLDTVPIQLNQCLPGADGNRNNGLHYHDQLEMHQEKAIE
jgi:hypothetical protein